MMIPLTPRIFIILDKHPDYPILFFHLHLMIAGFNLISIQYVDDKYNNKVWDRHSTAWKHVCNWKSQLKPHHSKA